MKLKDKVVVVTGGGSGMGQECVLALLAGGSRVAAVDLREAGLQETARKAGAGDRLSLHVANVADREAVRALPDAVVAHHGAVDAVIQAAGIIQPFERILDLDDEAIERVLQVNLYGTIHVVRAFLPHLLQRPEAHLATVSSMGGFLPVPGQAIYGASKAAVKLMTEALYTELLETRVHVSCILPGAVATHISENSGVTIDALSGDGKAPRALPAPEAARIILDGIEADKVHILVGPDSKMMYLASRAAPERAARLIQRQMKGLLRPRAAPGTWCCRRRADYGA
ncbi:MAG: SDR family oxidoreductase [Myxococcota bacterium]